MYKGYRGNDYTQNNKRISGRIVFYAVRVISSKLDNSLQNFLFFSAF
jgi:hypothetical protein